MSGIFLTIQLDMSIRSIPLEADTADDLDSKFARLLAAYTVDKEVVEYQPGYVPTEEEVLAVDYELGGILGQITTSLPTGVGAIDPRLLEKDPPIALIHVKTGPSPIFSFQAITRTNLMTPQKALFFAKGAFAYNEGIGIAPTNRLDAVYEGGQLLFKNEHQVRRFLDMEQYFVEASDEVLEDFFHEDKNFIVEDMDKLKKSAGKTLRRRIAKLSSEGKTYDMRRVKAAAEIAKIEVTFKKKALVLPSDKKGLKQVVDLLSDSYLRGLVHSDDVYFASYKRRVS